MGKEKILQEKIKKLVRQVEDVERTNEEILDMLEFNCEVMDILNEIDERENTDSEKAFKELKQYLK